MFSHRILWGYFPTAPSAFKTSLPPTDLRSRREDCFLVCVKCEKLNALVEKTLPLHTHYEAYISKLFILQNSFFLLICRRPKFSYTWNLGVGENFNKSILIHFCDQVQLFSLLWFLRGEKEAGMPILVTAFGN